MEHHDHPHGHSHDHDHPHDHDHSSDSNVNIDLSDVIDWLGSKRTTLWSVWSIADDHGKQQAAEWFYREIEGLIHFTINNRLRKEVKG